MILFENKGDGLHEAVRAAGYVLMQVNGVWQADNEPAVQAIIDAYSLDSAKQVMRLQIDAYAKNLRDKVVRLVSTAEMASWSMKRAEALAYNASLNPDDAPTLAAEAQARESSLDAIVQRVLANAQSLASLEATIAGVSGKHKDAIELTTTFSALISYDWKSGWPDV